MIQFSLKRISTVGPKCGGGGDKLSQTRPIPRSPDSDNNSLVRQIEWQNSSFMTMKKIAGQISGDRPGCEVSSISVVLRHNLQISPPLMTRQWCCNKIKLEKSCLEEFGSIRQLPQLYNQCENEDEDSLADQSFIQPRNLNQIGVL